MSKGDLDRRLRTVVTPAPIIHVGPAYPIHTFSGFNDPYPGWYLGARVLVDEALTDGFFVEEVAQNLSRS